MYDSRIRHISNLSIPGSVEHISNRLMYKLAIEADRCANKYQADIAKWVILRLLESGLAGSVLAVKTDDNYYWCRLHH